MGTFISLSRVMCFLFMSLVSTSVAHLQFSEAIEVDDLIISENVDKNLDGSKQTPSEDSDNDNETLQTTLDLGIFREYRLGVPSPTLQTTHFLELQNLYLFAFISELIRPPNLS